MPQPGQFLHRLRSFPSLLIFFAAHGSGLGTLRALLASTAYALVYTLVAMATGRVSKLDFGVVLFWIFLLAGQFFFPQTGDVLVAGYFTSLFYLCLFLAAYLPLVFGGEPFTMTFARASTPRELWRTEQFLAINRIMTCVWSGLFLIALLVSLLPGIWFKAVLPVLLMLGVGLPFTRKFPSYYLETRKTGGSQAGQRLQATQANDPPPVPVRKSADEINRERRQAAESMDKISNVLIIFGSPRGKRGHTYGLLEKFMDGMASAGAHIDFVSLAEKKIRPCTGCFTCWTKTPGQCILQDDMAGLLEKATTADLLIYAQPLYTFSVPGLTKNFLDRMLPQLEPYLLPGRNGTTRHPMRWRKDVRRRMLIFSVCGFPEVHHFQPMLDMFRSLAANSEAVLVGEILRSASESLLFKERYAGKYRKLEEDLRKAGSMVIRDGYVSRELEDEIAAPFFHDTPSFQRIANLCWDTMIEYEEKKRAGQSLPGRDEYLQEHPRLLFGGMASLYDPLLSDELKGVLQFVVTDGPGGEYCLHIDTDGCRLEEGRTPQPDCTIRTPWQVWLAISRDEVSGQDAYRRKLYEVDGDFSLFLKFREALQI